MDTFEVSAVGVRYFGAQISFPTRREAEAKSRILTDGEINLCGKHKRTTPSHLHIVYEHGWIVETRQLVHCQTGYVRMTNEQLHRRMAARQLRLVEPPFHSPDSRHTL